MQWWRRRKSWGERGASTVGKPQAFVFKRDRLVEFFNERLCGGSGRSCSERRAPTWSKCGDGFACYDPVMAKFRMDVDPWKLAELAGVWAAAFAAVYAARTALWIAKRQDQIQLKVSAADGLVLGGGEPEEDVVLINVTNLGRRPASLHSIGWKMSRFVKTRLYQNVDDPRNPKLPITLQDGNTATFVIPVERQDQENWYNMLAQRFMRFGRLRRKFEIRQFKFCAYCTTGEIFCVTPSSNFQKRLREAILSKEVLLRQEQQTSRRKSN